MMEAGRRRKTVSREQHGAGRRLLGAMGQLVVSPIEACNYGLDSFFNTRGAIGAVLGLFSLSVVVTALLAWGFPTGEHETGDIGYALSLPVGVLFGWLFPSGGQGTMALGMTSSLLFVILLSGMHVVATAAAIALYNLITGKADDFVRDCGSLLSGSCDDFIGDFGSLALSFALICATTTLLTAPVYVVVALTGRWDGGELVGLLAVMWTLLLQTTLVTAVTDMTAFGACGLLISATMIGWIATSSAASLFGGGS